MEGTLELAPTSLLVLLKDGSVSSWGSCTMAWVSRTTYVASFLPFPPSLSVPHLQQKLPAAVLGHLPLWLLCQFRFPSSTGREGKVLVCSCLLLTSLQSQSGMPGVTS